jgi:hypothetical protein
VLRYTRYPEFDFTWFVSEGHTPIGDWLETVRRYGMEGMTRFELYDLRGHITVFSPDDIGEILKQTIADIDLRPPGGKTAVVVNDVVQLGLTALYSAYAKSYGITTETNEFSDVRDAAAWLGKDIAVLVLKHA